MMNKFPRNSDSDEKTSWPSPPTPIGLLRLAVGPIPWIDTTVPLLQVLVTRRYFASEGNFQYVYGELVGMVKNRLVQSPPSNLLRGALRYPTYIDICSNPTPYFTRQCLIVDSERIARSNPASSNKTLTCSLQSLPFASSNVSGFSCLFKKSNRG